MNAASAADDGVLVGPRRSPACLLPAVRRPAAGALGEGAASRRPGTARRAAADAWWARIAARSPSANRPAAAAFPSARSTGFGPVQGGKLDCAGHLGPDPGRARRGGLGQPQPGAVADGEELRLGRGAGLRPAVQRPGGAGG